LTFFIAITPKKQTAPQQAVSPHESEVWHGQRKWRAMPTPQDYSASLMNAFQSNPQI